MLKKALAAGLLAILAIFAIPTAASAASYGGNGSGGGTIVVVEGQQGSITFYGFQPGEVTYASGPDGVIFESASLVAGPDGSVTYRVTGSKVGSFTITVTGASNISTGVVTTVPADSSGGSGSGSGSNANGTLPNTGLQTPTLVVWGASGVLVLGVALVLVLSVVRRNKNAA